MMASSSSFAVRLERYHRLQRFNPPSTMGRPSRSATTTSTATKPQKGPIETTTGLKDGSQGTKCLFLEMLPMEIRFRVFDLLVAPLETAEVAIQIEHTEKKMGDDIVVVLSKTCKQMQGEYQAWLKSHPTLRMSPRYGLFVPERTTFFMSFRPRTYRNLSYNRTKAALPVFERFCQEPAHADVRKVTVDYGWLGDRSAFIRMAQCMRAFNHLEIFEVITPISDGKRCGWYDWETYEETFTSESWDDLKGAGFKDGRGQESLCFVVTDSVVFHETWANVVELGAEASVF